MVSRNLLVIFSASVPLLVILSVWYPEFQHYYVSGESVSDTALGQLRTGPAEDVLAEVTAQNVLLGLELADEALLELADALLEGILALPGFPAVSMDSRFSAEDLRKGSPTFRLFVASLVVPEILLRAYEVSGAEPYFDYVRINIMSWARYERSVWLPNGFLWNDHAIAARVFVLSRFWRVYRSHPDYRAPQARLLLRAVSRSAEFLAKPAHFTFATNHGVMQNLALLHVCITFPKLPGAEQYKRLAITRLRDQLRFYMSPEGVVLEHSASYHEIGVMLLARILRYMSILDVPVPASWRTKYIGAVTFLRQIRRPDGTLPRFGDSTAKAADKLSLASFMPEGYVPQLIDQTRWGKPRPHYLAELSGYAVWWDSVDQWPKREGLRQTVIGWSYFPGHGHKHADEMSVLLWADEQQWWTNVGYWPYGRKLYDQAQSWPGSNALHLVNEAKDSDRVTKVRYYGNSDDLAFIELERIRPDGYRATRQVIHVQNNMWVVIDQIEDPANRRSQVIWTTNPDVAISKTGSHNYRLHGRQSGSTLAVTILGSNGVKVSPVVSGSTDPFAGWVADFTRVQKAPALVVDLPAESWSVNFWRLLPANDAPDSAAGPEMVSWQSSARWKMVLPAANGMISLRRQQQSLVARNLAGGRKSLRLRRGVNLDEQARTLRNNFEKAAEKYKPFKDVQAYRTKMSYALLFLLAVQESLLFVYGMLTNGARVSMFKLQTAAIVTWVGIGIWLSLIYFQV